MPKEISKMAEAKWPVCQEEAKANVHKQNAQRAHYLTPFRQALGLLSHAGDAGR